MPPKRKLEFLNLDEAFQEAESLSKSGYQCVGTWDLAQCCGHLNHWLSFPIDGFPVPGWPMSSILWVMKTTIGRKQLRKILTSGFTNGTPTMPSTVPPRDYKSEAAALSDLKATIGRFQTHRGPIHPSPLFGELDKQTVNQLQLRHFEHHLGFLLPNP